MFKKLKDKIAEEVKSSPQRIQQFAQAVVTSASSSISDISNNDLFSIADDETPQNSPRHSINKQQVSSGFQDVSLVGASSSTSDTPSPLKGSTGSSENNDQLPPLSAMNHQTGNTGIYPPPPAGSTRMRKLSNSSTASDVSFRLPSYESPGGMYHLQSDLDVSASEMEDSVSVPAQLERVSKEQLYAAYRRTNDKYNKYRGRYTDLARHYRNLERENAKARAVLVETQDKALRRISELREQCALEQGAKAHLENALRLDLEEKSLKIESLNTKIKLFQSFKQLAVDDNKNETMDSNRNTDNSNNGEASPNENHQPLIDLITDPIDVQDSSQKPKDSSLEDMEVQHSQEVFKLNDKIQKLEQLLAKFKEAIKSQKDKNSQVTSELQILSAQMEKKTVENEQLKTEVNKLEPLMDQLNQCRDQISFMKDELENYESKKAESFAVIQNELKSAKDEIAKLNKNIDILKKREEENAISLAENKLSIHKELESKEKEIKVLNDKISAANLEIKNDEGALKDLKAEIKTLEIEKSKMREQLATFDSTKEQVISLEGKLSELKSNHTKLEAKCLQLVENIKCKDLELKQEIDEKLAMKDRNDFLEGRNKHLHEDNSKKNKQIADLEREIMQISKQNESSEDINAKYQKLCQENEALKSDLENESDSKYEIQMNLESVSDKRDELQIDLDDLSKENELLQMEFSQYRIGMDVENKELEMLVNNFSKNEESLKYQIKQLTDRLKKASETNKSERALLVEKIQQEMKQKMDKSLENVKKSFEGKLSSFDALEKECADLKVELETKERSISDLEHSIQNKLDTETKCEELLQEKTTLKSILNSINQEMNTLKEEFVKEKQQMESLLHEKVKQLDAPIAELEHVKGLNQKLQVERNEVEEKLVKFNEMEKQINDSLMTKDELLIEKESLVQRVKEITAEANIMKEECQQLRKDKVDLEGKTATLEAENMESTSRRNALIEDIQQLQSEIHSVNESHKQIVSQKNFIEEKIAEMEKAEASKKSESAAGNEELQNKIKELHSDKDRIICERADLSQKVKELQQKVSANDEVWQVKLSDILEENNSLQEKCGKIKQEKDSLAGKLTALESKLAELEELKKKSEEAKMEIEFLNMRLSQFDNDLAAVKNEKSKVLVEKEAMQKELSATFSENNIKLSKINEDLVKLKAELDKVNREKATVQSKLDSECSQREDLMSKLKASQDKCKEIETLLKEKAEMTKQLSDMQQKYATLESDKCQKLELKSKEYVDLTALHSSLKAENESQNVKLHVLEKIEMEYQAMLEERHTLRSEVSKLMSDIEGLQTHLKKVSKDNSQLSDRIRELEASGEVMQQINIQNKLEAVPGALSVAEMQTQLNKLTDANAQLLDELKQNENIHSRVSDLERQNSILIDEKLELQDQINSSMHRPVGDQHSERDMELNSLRVQCRDLLSIKMDLEGRLADLELISRSGDSSIKALEQKNDKMKLSNEKLERRLDEALVSLNHIRTLEENTELEYLRNILYEYLTGPTNNNMVLAKVLSAVVKFDQRQTQIVLEREKERQSLLGQLGLL